MYGPLGPARRRQRVLGAQKYLFSIEISWVALSHERLDDSTQAGRRNGELHAVRTHPSPSETTPSTSRHSPYRKTPHKAR